MLKSLKKIRERIQDFTGNAALQQDLSAEKRNHQRFDITHLSGAMVEFPTGDCLPLLDISYGGLSTGALPEALSHLAFRGGCEAKVFFMGQSCEMRLALISSAAERSGFSFIHADPSTLIFLWSFLEGMRQGASVTVLDRSVVGPRFQEAQWTVMRGDGPVDINFQSTGGLLIETGQMTFARGERYHELRLQGQRIFTSSSIDTDRTASRMVTSQHPDPEILARGAQILLGAYETTKLEPLKAWFKLVVARSNSDC